VLGLVLPNNNLDAPTVRLSKNNASSDKFTGRHELNLLLIRIAVINKMNDVTHRRPRSSIRITKVGVLFGSSNKKLRS
jgi:hypothetical protein